MRKFAIALAAILFLGQAPAEASVLGKVKAVAKMPVLVLRNVTIMTISGVYLALLETEINWQEADKE